MAKMYPDQFISSKALGLENKAGDIAEAHIFSLLKELPSDFHIFHSYKSFSREIDFLILHPRHPLIFIEVKGGIFSSENGSYYTVNRATHKAHKINPIEQLHQATKEFKADLINNNIQLNCDIRYLVLFPDSSKPNLPIIGNLQGKVLFGSELTISSLTEKLDSYKQNSLPLGEDAFSSLLEIFTRVNRSQPYDVLMSVLKLNKEVNDKSAELVDMRLSQLLANRNLVIRGPAGTGKTLMLVALANKLAQTGKKVLITCYNDLIEDQLKAEFESKKMVLVRNFHNLCRYYIQKSPESQPIGKIETQLKESGRIQEFYNKILPELCQKAIESLSITNQLQKFDALLIDEAQDFNPMWLLTLRELISNESVVAVYTDPLQNIRQESEGLSALIDGVPIYLPLDVNLRNTKKVCELVSSFYLKTAQELNQSVSPLVSPSFYPEGNEPNIIEFEKINHLKDLLRSLLHSLTKEEKINPSHITILTSQSFDEIQKKEALISFGTKIGPFELSPYSDGKSKIQLETIRRFKGKENLVIVVIEMKPLKSQLRYVAYSRASARLYILKHLDK